MTLLFSVHWTEFRQLTNSGTLLNQGRYLFPLISIAGLAAAAALSLVPARARLTVLGAAVGALGVLELLSIGLTAARFYA